MNDKPTNDNPSKAHQKAEKNYSSGKSPEQPRRDLDTQRRKDAVKPVEPKK
jgi:hypothetical protein